MFLCVFVFWHISTTYLSTYYYWDLVVAYQAFIRMVDRLAKAQTGCIMWHETGQNIAGNKIDMYSQGATIHFRCQFSRSYVEYCVEYGGHYIGVYWPLLGCWFHTNPLNRSCTWASRKNVSGFPSSLMAACEGTYFKLSYFTAPELTVDMRRVWPAMTSQATPSHTSSGN